MVSNNNLYIDVMEKLKFDPSIEESNITVTIKDYGIVVLGGMVKSYSEKYLAEKAVEKISAVKGVANELEVNLNSSYLREDLGLLKAALNSLEWTFSVPHENIKVAVENGHITLYGEVKYNYQKEKAEEVVESLYGVLSITNNIKIIPHTAIVITTAEVKQKIKDEFKRNARIEASKILVEVHGGKITLKGNVKNFYEKKEARMAAWSMPGVSMVVDELKVSW